MVDQRIIDLPAASPALATMLLEASLAGLGSVSVSMAVAKLFVEDGFTSANVAITGGTIIGLDSPILVGSGGTGATTLTGDLVGNGMGAITALKHDLAATSNPGITDDNAAGYSIGSRWINVSTDQAFIALDVSTGAAVWKNFVARCDLNFVDGLLTEFLTVSTIRINTGSARDTTDITDIVATSNIDLDITASGAGGLDTGSEASDVWYALHIIGDTTSTEPTSGILSLSATSPTLPTGYNVFRRVGWVRNNSSGDFLKYIAKGNANTRSYYYDEEEGNTQVLSAGNANAFSPVSAASFVPPTSEEVNVFIRFRINNDNNQLYIRPTGSTVTNTLVRLTRGPKDTNDPMESNLALLTNTAQSFEYHLDVAGANSVDISIYQYKDYI